MTKPNMKAVKVYVERQKVKTEQCGTKTKGEKNYVGHGC